MRIANQRMYFVGSYTYKPVCQIIPKAKKREKVNKPFKFLCILRVYSFVKASHVAVVVVNPGMFIVQG